MKSAEAANKDRRGDVPMNHEVSKSDEQGEVEMLVQYQSTKTLEPIDMLT